MPSPTAALHALRRSAIALDAGRLVRVPSAVRLAHAVNERVAIAELETVARVIVRSAVAFGAEA